MGKGVTTISKFVIYNRWGEIMFSANRIPANDPVYGWDGTYKNIALKPDAYIYIVEAVCESGEPVVLKGDVSLIR
jgi:hypothetical protein